MKSHTHNKIPIKNTWNQYMETLAHATKNTFIWQVNVKLSFKLS